MKLLKKKKKIEEVKKDSKIEKKVKKAFKGEKKLEEEKPVKLQKKVKKLPKIEEKKPEPIKKNSKIEKNPPKLPTEYIVLEQKKDGFWYVDIHATQELRPEMYIDKAGSMYKIPVRYLTKEEAETDEWELICKYEFLENNAICSVFEAKFFSKYKSGKPAGISFISKTQARIYVKIK